MKKCPMLLIIMTKKSFGCVGVLNENQTKLIGIITDGDLKKIYE